MKEHTCKSGRKYFIKKLKWAAKKRLLFSIVKIDRSKIGPNFMPDFANIDFDIAELFIGLIKHAVLDADKKPIDIENNPYLDEDGDELFKVASDFIKLDPEELKKNMRESSSGKEGQPLT